MKVLNELLDVLVERRNAGEDYDYYHGNDEDLSDVEHLDDPEMAAALSGEVDRDHFDDEFGYPSSDKEFASNPDNPKYQRKYKTRLSAKDLEELERMGITAYDIKKFMRRQRATRPAPQSPHQLRKRGI